MNNKESFTFFWETNSPFSQWHPAQFVWHNILYNCTEQWMMSKKAEIFGDISIYCQIMASSSPREQKALGRKVSNFNPNIWDRISYEIVLFGNILKFKQNESLYNQLIQTGKTILVEASPYDKIWGVGLSASDPLILDRANWKGENKLGKILTEIRDFFLC